MVNRGMNTAVPVPVPVRPEPVSTAAAAASQLAVTDMIPSYQNRGRRLLIHPVWRMAVRASEQNASFHRTEAVHSKAVSLWTILIWIWNCVLRMNRHPQPQPLVFWVQAVEWAVVVVAAATAEVEMLSPLRTFPWEVVGVESTRAVERANRILPFLVLSPTAAEVFSAEYQIHTPNRPHPSYVLSGRVVSPYAFLQTADLSLPVTVQPVQPVQSLAYDEFEPPPNQPPAR